VIIKKKIARTIAYMICTLILVNCTNNKISFLVCPYKYSQLVSQQDNLSLQREILFSADEYTFLIVKKLNKGKVEIAQHYRPQHTFSNKFYPLNVSWEEPLHISTTAIIDKDATDFGIAIKIDGENNWRIYWLSEEKLAKIKKDGIFYLPKDTTLPFLPLKSV
jgi:hypothetical protein